LPVKIWAYLALRAAQYYTRDGGARKRHRVPTPPMEGPLRVNSVDLAERRPFPV
jgi:hypothetical protein